MKNLLPLAAAVAMTCAAFSAHAAGEEWYVGGGVGTARANFNSQDFSFGSNSVFATVTESKDRNTTGYKAFAGYKINPNFSVELAYVDFGSFQYRYTDKPTGAAKDDVKINGINVSLVGMYPIYDKVSVLGKIGAFNSRTKSNFQQDATFAANYGLSAGSNSSNQTKLSAGLGLMYDINDKVSVRGEYEYFQEVGSTSTSGRIKPSLFSVSGVYKF